MPKPTFFNLPPEKQDTILEIAIEEFARHDYGVASISRLVKQAHISKGSFYQYFEDKQDLYLYLVDLAIEKEVEFLLAVEPPESQKGFFPYLRWLFERSSDFVTNDPRWCQLLYRASYGDFPFRDEVLHRTQLTSRSYLQDLVKAGIERGEITEDIDTDLAIFAIDALWEGSRYWIPRKLAIDFKNIDREDITEDKIKFVRQWFDGLTYILENGISTKKHQNTPH
ncbi:hypothetical protein AY599_26465 [Leptolyngbya valderiana BDU 20041]|nr:TetR/AcrR family transcriptional regulator [Geitlerinema sp. CS-897]OAB60778.1 hypothetical protein AY599_26465 [Leptolyngbya valderiana BDU 20041]